MGMWAQATSPSLHLPPRLASIPSRRASFFIKASVSTFLRVLSSPCGWRSWLPSGLAFPMPAFMSSRGWPLHLGALISGTFLGMATSMISEDGHTVASRGSPSQGLQRSGPSGLQAESFQCNRRVSKGSPAPAAKIYETIAIPTAAGHGTFLPSAGEHLQRLTSLVRTGIISPPVEWPNRVWAVSATRVGLVSHNHRVRTRRCGASSASKMI